MNASHLISAYAVEGAVLVTATNYAGSIGTNIGVKNELSF
jgi:hypothetical protein